MMRVWLILALITLAGPAHAGPVVAAIGALVGGVKAAIAAGGFLGFLARTALSVGISLLASVIGKKRPEEQRAAGLITEVTTSGGVTPQKFIVGRYASAGQLIAPPATHGQINGTPRAFLVYPIALSAIPGVSLERVIVNDTYLDIARGPESSWYGTNTSAIANRIGIQFLDGYQTSAYQPLLNVLGGDADRPWLSDMVGPGVAWTMLQFVYDRTMFSGLPSVRMEMLGIPLYDPRADTSVGGSGAQRWSNRLTWTQTLNPAVIIYNIMRGITLADGDIWGGDCEVDDLPLATWAAAMNECDLAIPIEGGTEPQYRCGFEIALSDEPAAIIAELLKTCAGQMVEVGGVWKIRVGPPALPSYFLTDDDVLISREQEFNPFPSLSDTFNGVTATYPEPVSLWESKDAPPRYNAAWEASDGNRRLMANLDLPACPYAGQVQRLMAALIADNRRFRRHRFGLPPEAAVLEPLDTISWTSARNGYTNKVMEITGLTDNLMTMTQLVNLREREAGDFAWTASQLIPSDLAPPGFVQAVLPGAPGVNILTEVKIVNQQPIATMIVDISWSGGAALGAQVQYRRAGDTVWRDVGASSAGRYEVQGVEPGEYDIRVRAVNSLGVIGDWLELLGRPVQVLELPPQDVTGFDIAVIGPMAHLTWDPVPDGDLSHYIIRWTPDIGTALYSNAVTVVPKVPRPGTSALVAAQTGTYFIRAVDKLGNESRNPAVITTTVAGVEGLNAVLTLDEAPSFTGVDVLFSQVSGLFAAAPGLFSASGGVIRPTRRVNAELMLTDVSVPGSGIYDFRETVDLGGRFTSRLTSRVSMLRKDDTAGLFSAAAGLFSARTGLFNGNQNFSDVEVWLEVSTSDNMVIWSAWRRLNVGDHTARGLRFRAVLTTLAANVSPLVTAMQVTIDMPDRTVAEADLASGVGPRLVTFPHGFKGLSGLGISAQGMASGDYYEITGKDAAGFTIIFKNAAGAAVARTFDYVATGYGANL
jgi:hypothetical protein